MYKHLFLVSLFCLGVCFAQSNKENSMNKINNSLKSIQEFGVLPTNSAAVNKENLQKAIDWAHPRGAALFADFPY